MKALRRVAAFLRAPAGRKRLALEAGWELLRARLLTLRAASRYCPALGRLVDSDAPPANSASTAVAAEIGHVAAVVARALPFRAECLQQAIAVRRMLARRGIPAQVCLGVAREKADRVELDRERAAHAWVIVGSRVVSGDGVLDRYAIVARFA